MSTARALYRFTADEFERLGRLGFFAEDDRVELLDGRIVRMSPVGPRHLRCVNRCGHTLYRAAGDAYEVSTQNPLRLGAHDMPQPDLALVRRRPGPDTVPAAADALLVVEVADTSLESDRRDKLPRYAAAGIPETWLLNLPEDTIERHTDPSPAGYRQIAIARRGETIASAVLPGLALDVDAILGQPGS